MMTGSAAATPPLTVASVAGGLATLNPCGFPLLAAFLSYYVGAGRSPCCSSASPSGESSPSALLASGAQVIGETPKLDAALSEALAPG